MISETKIYELEVKRIKALRQGKIEEAEKLEKELKEEKRRQTELWADAFKRGIVI